MKWPWSRREVRAAGGHPDYTAQRVAEETARAIEGSTGLSAIGFACILFISRAFAGVRVEGPDWLRDLVAGAWLAEAVGGMCRRGECFYAIDGSGARPSLSPCQTAEVIGGWNPLDWRYLVTRIGPSESETSELPASQVLHFRYWSEPAAPWRGYGPLQGARRTFDLHSTIEGCMRSEANGFSARMLQLPDAGAEEGWAEGLASDLNARERRSRLSILEDTEPDSGRLVDVRPSVDPGMVQLFSETAETICAAFGIPPALVIAPSGAGGGVSEREAFRRWVMTSARPLAAILGGELREKLETDCVLDVSTLRAADTVGSGRAVLALTAAGVPVAEAMRAVGLLDGEE